MDEKRNFFKNILFSFGQFINGLLQSELVVLKKRGPVLIDFLQAAVNFTLLFHHTCPVALRLCHAEFKVACMIHPQHQAELSPTNEFGRDAPQRTGQKPSRMVTLLFHSNPF